MSGSRVKSDGFGDGYSHLPVYKKNIFYTLNKGEVLETSGCTVSQ